MLVNRQRPASDDHRTRQQLGRDNYMDAVLYFCGVIIGTRRPLLLHTSHLYYHQHRALVLIYSALYLLVGDQRFVTVVIGLVTNACQLDIPRMPRHGSMIPKARFPVDLFQRKGPMLVTIISPCQLGSV